MTFTLQEIESQPEIWRLTLDAFEESQGDLPQKLSSISFDRIVVCGCGSTYYFAHSAAQHIRLNKFSQAIAYPSSEVWLMPGLFSIPGTCLLAVSRSGTTTETLKAVERFREDGGEVVIAITCYPDSALAELADLVLAAPDAQEQSVVQTRSFTSMYLLMMALTYLLVDQLDLLAELKQLPQVLEALTSRYGGLPTAWGRNMTYQKVFFLGSGPFYGLACEAMLKLKEMSLTWTAAYHTLEIRHGPMSLVDDSTLVVSMLSDTAAQLEMDVLRDMGDLGADVALCSSDRIKPSHWTPNWHITTPGGLNEWMRGPLFLALLHRLGYHRAVAKGLNPDLPTNLQAVIKI